MELNNTDRKIIANFWKGKSLARIAKLIGRPGDIQRVKDSLKRGEIPEKRWLENEK